MFRRIDQSTFLIRRLEWLSTFLARRRGLPIIIGIALIAVGAIFEVVNIAAGSSALHVVHVVMHNVGLIAALIGLLLSEPLGR